MRASLIRVLFALLFPVAGFAQSGAAPTAEPGPADARLRALYEREWAWRQAEGLHRERTDEVGIDHLPHVDPETQAAHLAYWTQALAELDAISNDQLSPEERINAAVFRRTIQTLADDA